ncbi:MAG: hypothetical protein WED07_01070 [Candidatus Freyarchaeum deiterrae]
MEDFNGSQEEEIFWMSALEPSKAIKDSKLSPVEVGIDMIYVYSTLKEANQKWEKVKWLRNLKSQKKQNNVKLLK